MAEGSDATVINDRYEVRRRVGRGGMADVFMAHDLLLNRDIAVKVLFPEFAVDPKFVERFRREAQSAASLSHPNIVNVYDWGKFEGTYFIAMEFVEGRTLADILKGGRRLNARQASEIASEVAAALGFAHEAGIAHRDIKPANILIGSNGVVKVADFGIARLMNGPAEANLTQAGSVMGTATYFSPEQAQGALPDPRSDLYSLGIVMYEMVAGQVPFTGEMRSQSLTSKSTTRPFLSLNWTKTSQWNSPTLLAGSCVRTQKPVTPTPARFEMTCADSGLSSHSHRSRQRLQPLRLLGPSLTMMPQRRRSHRRRISQPTRPPPLSDPRSPVPHVR